MGLRDAAGDLIVLVQREEAARWTTRGERVEPYIVGIFPNEAAITRLVGAILMEQSDEWAVRRARYMTLETMAPVSDIPIIVLSAVTGT